MLVDGWGGCETVGLRGALAATVVAETRARVGTALADLLLCRHAAPALLAALVQHLLDSRAVAKEAASSALVEVVAVVVGSLMVMVCLLMSSHWREGWDG